MRFCRDCKWFDGGDGTRCTNPSMATVDAVQGPLSGHPKGLREDGGRCGPGASGYEPRVIWWRRLFPTPPHGEEG
jgi:hypothetical protein